MGLRVTPRIDGGGVGEPWEVQLEIGAIDCSWTVGGWWLERGRCRGSSPQSTNKNLSRPPGALAGATKHPGVRGCDEPTRGQEAKAFSRQAGSPWQRRGLCIPSGGPANVQRSWQSRLVVNTHCALLSRPFPCSFWGPKHAPLPRSAAPKKYQGKWHRLWLTIAAAPGKQASQDSFSA